jgi:hypothetical protein
LIDVKISRGFSGVFDTKLQRMVVLAMLAIGVFAGVRDAEIKSLDWPRD